MKETREEPTEGAQLPAPVVDLLKRHTTLPSRGLILSEAYELARRLKNRDDSPSDAAGSPGTGAS